MFFWTEVSPESLLFNFRGSLHRPRFLFASYLQTFCSLMLPGNSASSARRKDEPERTAADSADSAEQQLAWKAERMLAA